MAIARRPATKKSTPRNEDEIQAFLNGGMQDKAVTAPMEEGGKTRVKRAPKQRKLRVSSTGKVQVLLRLDVSLVDDLDEIAVSMHLPRTSLMTVALGDYAKRWKKGND